MKGVRTMGFKKAKLKGDFSSIKRIQKALKIRNETAVYYKKLPKVEHPGNGDERRYPNKIASYIKALPQNSLGEVDLRAYDKYLEAIETGEPEDFEKIPLGGERKLVNPQSAYSFDLVGPDSHQMVCPPPPAFHSEEFASEMVELYRQALTRDVPFNDYHFNPLTIAAAEELTTLTKFHGPKINGQVTPKTLFRQDFPGALEGPYISQFLWKDFPFIATKIVQKYKTTLAGDDHLTNYEDWLAVQTGKPLPSSNIYDSTPRYIRNGRDLGEFVHKDYSLESGLAPCLILLSYGPGALDASNPYLKSKTQVGFSSFGAAHVLDFVLRAVRPALDAAWCQKWLVHRRIRPEEFGGRIHHKMTGDANYPIHPVVLNSNALSNTLEKYKTYLLPQAFAEGCPTHPEYPSGHATFIGAMVTMLKAFFNESFVIPDPVVASSDGLSLESYNGTLTVGGELNKLAYNIAIGRNTAGVHFRSSAINGMLLGEQVAIGILRDYQTTYNEEFEGFSLTKFDGTKISI
jgi:hypothetical protein